MILSVFCINTEHYYVLWRIHLSSPRIFIDAIIWCIVDRLSVVVIGILLHRYAWYTYFDLSPSPFKILPAVEVLTVYHHRSPQYKMSVGGTDGPLEVTECPPMLFPSEIVWQLFTVCQCLQKTNVLFFGLICNLALHSVSHWKMRLCCVRLCLVYKQFFNVGAQFHAPSPYFYLLSINRKCVVRKKYVLVLKYLLTAVF